MKKAVDKLKGDEADEVTVLNRNQTLKYTNTAENDLWLKLFKTDRKTEHD